MSQDNPSRTCHRCGRQFTGHFCPCRRHKSSSSSGQSSGRRSNASRTVFLSSSSAPTVTIIPLWESDPDRFWGTQVYQVRRCHNAGGDQFILAYFGNSFKMFPLADVCDQVEKFWIIRPEPTQVAA